MALQSSNLYLTNLSILRQGLYAVFTLLALTMYISLALNSEIDPLLPPKCWDKGCVWDCVRSFAKNLIFSGPVYVILSDLCASHASQ